MLQLEEYKRELVQELHEILAWWLRHGPDPVNGGFFGKIDAQNQVYLEAPRGIVLYSRILWTFSASYNHSGQRAHLEMADSAYEFISRFFVDPGYGGVYWTVDHQGIPIDQRKEINGLAFCIYGLSEYYKVSKIHEVLDLAIRLFRLIEQHAFDRKRKGYFQSFSANWSLAGDSRPGTEPARESKMMNIHLHILEAYTNLYGVWRNAGLRSQIEGLLEVFAHHFVDAQTHHLNVSFDADWNSQSNLVSYGHDIEAAWLLQLAAETIRHPGWTMTMKSLAVKIADAATEGLDTDGALNYESDYGCNNEDKLWWPQAEAMIGFYNAYQVSGNEQYLKKSMRSWQFIQAYIKDDLNGEWIWGVHADHSLIEGQDKAGFWKCPYHNGRACLELIHRIAPELIFHH